MILDTNALSALSVGDEAVMAHFGRASQVQIPVIVLGEFRFGIGQLRRPAEHKRWFDELLSVCGVLPIDPETTAHYAELRTELQRAGTPIPSNDVWIGALCRQHSLPILSQDRHFDWMKGVKRHSW